MAGRGALAPGTCSPSLGGSLLTGVPQTLGSPPCISTTRSRALLGGAHHCPAAKEWQQGNHTAVASDYRVPGMSRAFLCPPLRVGSVTALLRMASPCSSATGPCRALTGIAADGVSSAEEPLRSRAGAAAAGNPNYPVPECHLSATSTACWEQFPGTSGGPLQQISFPGGTWHVCPCLGQAFRAKELWQVGETGKSTVKPKRKAEAAPGFEDG